MKNLTAVSLSSITIDSQIKVEDAFADILDYLIKNIQTYYSTCQIDFKKDPKDTKGLSVSVTSQNCKVHILHYLKNYVDAKLITYDQDNNLISYKIPEGTKTSTTGNTINTSDLNANTSDTSTGSVYSASREKFKNAAYGAVANTIASKGQSAIAGLTEEIEKIKKLMIL